MKSHRNDLGTRYFAVPLLGAVAVTTLMLSAVQVTALADPADDALVKLQGLSRQAEQTNEAMYSARLDLDAKLATQHAAEKKHDEDAAAADAAKARLASFQSTVDNLAAATYMGGGTHGLEAILTVSSPQGLIDKMTMQRVMARQMATQMSDFRIAGDQAATAERESAKSAEEAKQAASQAAAVADTLQHKQSQLQTQIAVVQAQYDALTPKQRIELADPGPMPPGRAGGPLAGNGDGQGPGGPADGVTGGGGDRENVVQAALAQVGTPYVWGGAGPGGFDCSGLVMWAFQQAGIALPHSSQALARGGQAVSLSDLQPGDVLTFYSDASHTGIYIGDGLMVHSPTFGQPVRVVPMTSSGPIYDARRY